MELNIVIAGPVSDDIHFNEISLVLEQYCTMKSVRCECDITIMCRNLVEGNAKPSLYPSLFPTVIDQSARLSACYALKNCCLRD